MPLFCDMLFVFFMHQKVVSTCNSQFYDFWAKLFSLLPREATKESFAEPHQRNELCGL